jgi:2-dehydro-3-deoxygluconokinase
MSLNIKNASDAKYDILSLGEAMVRLSPPGHGRIEFSKTLEVDVGGGEFNVAYACARLGLRGGFVSKFPDNPVAHIALNHARAVGLDVSNVVLGKYDGVGRSGRVGLNFTEVGTGVRASVTLYDRGHSAIALADPADFDFDDIFGKQGSRWLHTGGIMAALSPNAAEITRRAAEAAHANGTIVSYDLNFRSKLWSSKAAIEANRKVIPNVDVLIGNEEDFMKALGFEVEGLDENFSELPIENYKRMVEKVVETYPNIKLVCTTLREVTSGLINNWGGILYADGQFYEARPYKGLEIEDRVGGGDGFSSGIAYGSLQGYDPQDIVDFGAAHGALLQSTRGDTSQITLEEVLHVKGGGSARIKR